MGHDKMEDLLVNREGDLCVRFRTFITHEGRILDLDGLVLPEFGGAKQQERRTPGLANDVHLDADQLVQNGV
jgi:hypothetical protein